MKKGKGKCGERVDLILDLGEPPSEGKPNPAFEVLFSLGATKGSRISMNSNVLPSTDNMVALMDRVERQWACGDFSVEAIALWVMPESAFFLKYCQRLGVDPTQHLLEILKRAKEINARHGDWRIILQLRAEFDSNFFESPGSWKDRKEAYENWERFNLTSIHFERSIKFGYAPCRDGMTNDFFCKDLFEFFKKHNLRLSDFPADVCCNRAFDIHHNFRWGWPCVSVENFCGTGWNSHLLIAYARGGAKEYKARWGCDYSPWGAVAGLNNISMETMYHRDGRWFGGLSASHQLRAWMMGFLSGANYVEVEVADRTHFVLDHEPVVPKDDFGGDVNKRIVRGKQDLSPAGVNGVAFGKYALERHPDRGQPYANMAVIVHSQNGWNVVGAGRVDDVVPAPADPHINPYQAWWGRLESTPAEWMLGAFYRRAFEAEPIYAFQNGCWRKFGAQVSGSTYNPDTQAERYKLLVDGRVKVEEAEEGRYMGRTRWGDTMDVFDEHVSLEVLRDYPVLILLGIVPETTDFWDRITQYVEGGGTVIANVAQIPERWHKFYGATWEVVNNGKSPALKDFDLLDGQPWTTRNWHTAVSVYETARKKGKTYLTTIPWAVHSPQDIDPEMVALIDELYAGVNPVKITGEPTHWIINKLEKGWLVSIFNHFGNAWRGEISVKDCIGCLEQWEGKKMKGTKKGGSVLAEVPPYSFRIFYFEAVRRTKFV